MKVKYYLLFVCLLYVCAKLNGQTCDCENMASTQLSQYEYWFDNNRATLRTVSIGGSEALISELETNGLEKGFHSWHLRVKNAAGAYGGIISGYFYKNSTGGQKKMEYWYNDDFSLRHETVLPAGDSDGNIVFDDFIDVSDMPSGMNRFNLLIDGGEVYSCFVMKMVDSTMKSIEYWYNDDFGSRASLTIPDSADFTLASHLDMGGMPFGLNRFNFRAGGGNVHTSYVLKTVALATNKVEYWFDDDYAGRKITAQGTGNDSITVKTSVDVNGLSEGMHRINYRAVSNRTDHNPVMSDFFFKNKRTGNLEYWYNDNTERHTLELPEGDEPFVEYVDVRDMPFGLNRFNLLAPDGKVHSNYVMKTVAGATNKMEYWFDDNYAGRKIIHSSTYADKVDINAQLNVDDLSEGIHRINYRAVSNQTYHNPVMSDFFFKGNTPNNGEYNVTHAKLWVDDSVSKAITYQLNSPEQEVLFQSLPEFSTISTGMHKLHMQFMNSAGRWSIVESHPFNKILYKPGNLDLTAEADDDMVTLKWKSLSGISFYKLLRDGVIISTPKLNKHPENFEIHDYPAAGTHTYKVEAYVSNNKEIYKSEEKNVSITETAADKKEGTLLVYVQDPNGNFVEDVEVEYTASCKIPKRYKTSDNVTKIPVPFCYIANILPTDNKGRVTAIKEDYHFTHEETGNFYSISPESPTATVRFLATPMLPETVGAGIADLELASAIEDNIGYDIDGYYDSELTNWTFSITLKNRTQIMWNGYIYMKVTSMNETANKNYLVSFADIPYVEASIEPESNILWGLGSKGGTKTVTFNFAKYINKFPAGNFVVSIYSQARYGNTLAHQKLVASTSKYINPLIVPQHENAPIDLVTYEVVNELVNDVFKEIKAQHSIYKHLSTGFQTIKGVYSDYSTVMNTNDPILSGILSNATELFTKVASTTGKIIKNKEELEAVIGGYSDFMRFMKNPQQEISDVNNRFEPKSFFTISKYIMNKGGPLSSIFKPYFEVGEAMANAIENIDAFIFDNYEIHSLGLYAGPKYINILVDGFNSEQINSQINSVELYACSSNNGHCPELRGGSAYQIQLTRKTINNEGSSWEIVENNTGSPKSAQLKIIWNNGRILWVPLTSKCSKLTGFGSNLRIDVRLKSGNRLAKHMADKIHIKKP